MKNKELKQFFKENLFNKNGRFEGQRLKKKWFELRNFLSTWNNYKDIFTDQENVFCFMRDNGLLTLDDDKKYPKCKICGKETEFVSRKDGYKKYCSGECANVIRTRTKKNFTEERKEEINQKRKETTLKKYGTEYITQSVHFREKSKQTCLEKYGDENFNNREKSKQTCLKKYGADNPQKVQEIREKSKNTCLEKYGDICMTKTNHFKEKSKQTCLKKYGTEFASQTTEFKETVKQTNLEKYGYEYNLKDPEFIKKSEQTNLERYGVRRPAQSPEIKEKIKLKMLEKDENGLNGYDRSRLKMLEKDENGLNGYDRLRKTNEENGKWLPLEEYSDFQLYCRLVKIETSKYMKNLKNYDKRGNKKNEYHCDHRYSKYQGFKDCILPYIIGAECNLKMINSRVNMSKNIKCSIKKEVLFERFFRTKEGA